LDEILSANAEQEDIEARRNNIILYRVSDSNQARAEERPRKDFKNVAVCNMQHDYTDFLGLNSLVNEFVATNGRCLQLFVKF